MTVTARFRTGEIPVLVTTDVAARGIGMLLACSHELRLLVLMALIFDCAQIFRCSITSSTTTSQEYVHMLASHRCSSLAPHSHKWHRKYRKPSSSFIELVVSLELAAAVLRTLLLPPMKYVSLSLSHLWIGITGP